MIKYPKTRQFSDAIRDVRHKARFKGLDENNQPVYSEESLPVIPFTGTVKLHGTNAGISWNAKDGLTCQSRNRVVSQGHFGFPEMIEREIEYVEEILEISINKAEELGLFREDRDTISIFGEWAGPGIQNGVAISQIPEKVWFIFGVKVNNKEGEGIWLDIVRHLSVPDCSSIKNIHSYTEYVVDIDFNNPKLIQNYLIKCTEEVENQCPVAKEYGVSGIGEGIVWSAYWKGERIIFKTKGEKHSSSKVKTLASVNPEKVKSILEFVENYVSLNRVQQAIREVSDIKDIPVEQITRRDTGDVIRWVVNDIFEEGKATMHASGIEKKDVSKEISHKSRKKFFDILDTIE